MWVNHTAIRYSGALLIQDKEPDYIPGAFNMWFDSAVSTGIDKLIWSDLRLYISLQQTTDRVEEAHGT
jgi:hypothetical protein